MMRRAEGQSDFTAHVDAGTWRGEAFFVGERGARRRPGRRRPSRVNDSTLLERKKSAGRESAGKTGRAAGGQHVRRAGGVIAHGHRACSCPRKMAPAWRMSASNSSALVGGDVQVLRRDYVGQLRGFVLVAHQHQRAELLQALPRQVATRQVGRLPLPARRPWLSISFFAPGDQDARAGACSAWAIRSAAVKSGRVESSAITTTSLGPAMESISTSP